MNNKKIFLLIFAMMLYASFAVAQTTQTVPLYSFLCGTNNHLYTTNYQEGTRAGCTESDPFIIGYVYPSPEVSPSNLQYITSTEGIIKNYDKCGKKLLNVRGNIKSNALCQPWGEWQFVEDETDTERKENPFGADEQRIPAKYSSTCVQGFHATGCCPQTECWDGTTNTCKSSGEFFDAGKTGFECNNGNWQQTIKKTNPNKQLSGFCSQKTQCLVHPRGNKASEFENHPEKFFTAGNDPTKMPQCIADKQYLKDEYCDDGNWTTRTKLLAVQMISLAESNTETRTNYDLFCDNYTNTLNEVKYHTNYVGSGLAEDFMKTTCRKGNTATQPGMNVPCVNNFCVLKINQEVAAIGTSLNAPINYEMSFLRALNLSKNYCDNIQLTATEFKKCTPTSTTSANVWYNPGIESIIYFPPSVATNLQDTYTKPQFKKILDYAIARSTSAITNFDFYNKTGLFNRLMYSKKGERTIFAFLEEMYRTEQDDYPPLNHLGVKYSGFSLKADPCLFLFKPKMANPSCETQLNSNEFVILGPNNPLQSWRDLTAKLRLIAGPIKPMTTDLDTGQTRLPQTQPPQNECE